MQQAMTMRQLSAASQEPAEAAETVEAEPDRAEGALVRCGRGSGGLSLRPWWRRWFGG